MIELRWVKGSKPIGDGTYGVEIRVLQYRVRGVPTYTSDADGHITRMAIPWKEWQDVPEVDEARGGGGGK